MPRGVPANGKRRPRAADPGSPATSEVPPAFDEDRDDGPADDETIPVNDEMVAVHDESVEPEELSPEQLEIKHLRDLLAQERGRKDVEPETVELTAPGDSRNILIHFLEDGLTAMGQVRYRGEELEFEPGSPAHKDTFDRRGRSWLDLRGDDFAQVDRWGRVMFRPGPWPGRTYAEGSFEALRALGGEAMVEPPTPEELERAEKARKRRAAPRLPSSI